MLSAAELASIQSDAVKATCDMTCKIYRISATTPGASGEPSSNWSLIVTTVAGMSEPTANQLANYDYLIGALAAWHVRLPIGTNVQHDDHLVIGTHTLVVQKILEPRSYAAMLSLLATEIN